MNSGTVFANQDGTRPIDRATRAAAARDPRPQEQRPYRIVRHEADADVRATLYPDPAYAFDIMVNGFANQLVRSAFESGPLVSTGGDSSDKIGSTEQIRKQAQESNSSPTPPQWATAVQKGMPCRFDEPSHGNVRMGGTTDTAMFDSAAMYSARMLAYSTIVEEFDDDTIELDFLTTEPHVSVWFAQIVANLILLGRADSGDRSVGRIDRRLLQHKIDAAKQNLAKTLSRSRSRQPGKHKRQAPFDWEHDDKWSQSTSAQRIRSGLRIQEMTPEQLRRLQQDYHRALRDSSSLY